jgi:RND superfamily putative drug exporter
VIAIWIASIALFAGIAAAAGGGFVNNFSLPGSESQKAVDLLQEKFPEHSGDSDQIVFHATKGTLSDPADRQAIAAIVKRVERFPSVAGVESPLHAEGQISQDGKIGFATLLFDKQATSLDKDETKEVVEAAQVGATPDLEVQLGGRAVEQAESSGAGASDLIGVGVAIVVLIVVLGSGAAMTMPLAMAFAAIGLAMTVVLAASSLIDIAEFAPTLAVMLGLGVGIDYGLLVVNRFRGERGSGADVRAATLTAVDTAGRSVLFAGATVVIALLGMLILGVGILNGPAVAAALTVAATMLSALTLLPALLHAYGHRVKVPAHYDPDQEAGFWSRFSGFVHRRPLPLALGSVVLLLILAVPATGMNLGLSDAGNLPEQNTARKSYDLLSEGFGPGFNGPLLVVAETPTEGAAQRMDEMNAALEGQPGVAAVTPPVLNSSRDTAVMQVIPESQPQDTATNDLVERLRDDVMPGLERKTGTTVDIGGATATGIDVSQVLTEKLPLFIIIVVGLSLILLTVVFRSLFIALTAGVMNLLTIGAALGIITFVFQDGHLASLIGVDTTGPIESFLPIFLFAIIFGLSMDYEVFLVSRMHEIWERTHDSDRAVRHGLALTGKIITAAAVIMISVFGSFMLGDERVIKLFGLGLASAILFDAFVVRLILVPSLMTLAGTRTWWLPSWLGRRLPHLSVEGPDEVREEPA